MRIRETVLGYIPIVLMLAGAILYFVPATWVELPIETTTLGMALFALGGVLLYAGWYDRFDTESDTSADETTYKFDAESDTIADDTTSPAQTTGYLATAGNYGSWILISIGAVLSWGQIRNPDRVSLVDRAPLELPWGEQPVVGFGFILAGLALFVLIHIAIPFFQGD
ncbi:hypothetical protein [Haloarcula sp. 1CSR25-25]|uniref:hypothetical protein n=1 Tax=Haloarcula sp. 1CSR25-25 TaxID=2862545 RepID=UPI002895F197|nr:hypothetical protein [Haloarcula sp. 1CSR25-25]MDT3437971.1 hypothetical protein [Haloarcula sp. 1CSR25-25]